MRRAVIAAVGIGMALSSGAMAQTRFHQYTAKYKSPPSPATPIASGYLGGSGDEYLAGGAFLPDGTVVLGGTALGPVFNPAGARVTVVGRDGAAPASPVTESTDRRGRKKLSTPDWTFTGGAGFLAQLDPRSRSFRKVVRFPWGSGSLTDVTAGPDGSLYVAGTCGANFGSLVQAKDVDTGLAGAAHFFVGKVRADLSGFEWCNRIADDLWSAPRLKIVLGNTLSVVAGNAFHFDARGALLKATELQKTNSWSRGVDPVTHATATGGDRNTNTGWEPWRQPILFIYNDKGEHSDQFYEWSPKLVGLNRYRLVSDSDVRVLSYDNQGKLIVVGWSDGGNSVFEYCPYDLNRSVYAASGSKGLGFSLWGAGVGSFCHIMKIDPDTGEPLGKTVFCAYLKSKNKPSGLGLNAVDSATDGSMLMGGGSAYGLIETGNKVNTMSAAADDYIGGSFVAVFTPKMDSIRFSSCMPGGGAVNLGRHNKSSFVQWGIGTGTAQGRPMALFVCGAKQADKFISRGTPQAEFGGGFLDGQFVILSL